MLVYLCIRENTCFTVYKYQFVFEQFFAISIYKGPVGPLVMDTYKRECKEESEYLMCVSVRKREGDLCSISKT